MEGCYAIFTGQMGSFRPAGIFCIDTELKSVSNSVQPWLKPEITVPGKIQFKLYPLIFVKNLCLCMGISIVLIAEAAWLAGLSKSLVLCITFTLPLSEVLSSCISHIWQGISKYLRCLNIVTSWSGAKSFLNSVIEGDIWSPLSRNKIR